MGGRFTAPADRGAGRTHGRRHHTAAEAELALEERLEAVSDCTRSKRAFVAQLLTRPPTHADLQRLDAMLDRIDDEVCMLLVEIDHTYLLPDPAPATYERRA